MFSGHCRSVVRRVACQNFLEGPLVQGNHYVLSSEHERDHHHKPNDPGHGADGDEKKPKSGCNYCPFLLTKNIFEYLGLAGVCVLIGCDIRKEARKQLIRDFNAATNVPWQELVPRALWGNLISLNYARVLPTLPVSSKPPCVSQEELISFADLTSSDLNNMIGVALIKSGDTQDGIKFLEQSPNHGTSNYNLGVAHETGDASGKPDFEKAFTYYQKGAELGNNKSMFNLAIFYLIGKGNITKDIIRGKQLLQKAKEMGLSEAAKYIELLQVADQKLLKPDPQPSPGLHSSSSAPSMSSLVQDINRTSCEPFTNLHKEDGAIVFSIATK